MNASSPEIVSSVSGFSSRSSFAGIPSSRLSNPDGADSRIVVALRSGDVFGDVGDALSTVCFCGGGC